MIFTDKQLEWLNIVKHDLATYAEIDIRAKIKATKQKSSDEDKCSCVPVMNRRILRTWYPNMTEDELNEWTKYNVREKCDECKEIKRLRDVINLDSEKFHYYLLCEKDTKLAWEHFQLVFHNTAKLWETDLDTLGKKGLKAKYSRLCGEVKLMFKTQGC